MIKDRDLRTLAADSNDWQGALSKARDERDEAIAAARELLACWVPPEHQNSYLEHWGWLKVAEPTAAPAEGREG